MVWQEMQIVQILCTYTGSYKILYYNSEYCYLQEECKKRKKAWKKCHFFIFPCACRKDISQTPLPWGKKEKEKRKNRIKKKRKKESFARSLLNPAHHPPTVLQHFCCLLLQDGGCKRLFKSTILTSLFVHISLYVF